MVYCLCLAVTALCSAKTAADVSVVGDGSRFFAFLALVVIMFWAA